MDILKIKLIYDNISFSVLPVGLREAAKFREYSLVAL
jgi:hypothetical protein